MQISYSIAGALAVIDFDATIREEHASSVAVTDHNVEKGADVSDHARPELDRLTLDVHVTNAPIRVPGSNLDGASGSVKGLELQYPVKGSLPIAVPVVGAILASTGALDSTATVKANVLQFDGEFDRVRSVYNELHLLVMSRTLVSITSSLREYDNMILMHLSAPRTAQDGGSITFAIEAREMRFVATQTVAAPPAKKGMATKKANLGPKPPVPAADNSSFLYKLIHGGT